MSPGKELSIDDGEIAEAFLSLMFNVSLGDSLRGELAERMLAKAAAYFTALDGPTATAGMFREFANRIEHDLPSVPARAHSH